ncbi:hypothetical protein HDU67_004827, partial [Dinochytrium kinnereticum]
MAPKYAVGDKIPFTELTSVNGDIIKFTGSTGLIHLQLRRFSGCPVCSFHLRSMSRILPTLETNQTQEIIVFHSSREIILENQVSVDWTRGFTFVADPKRDLYKALGAEFSGGLYLFRLRWSTLWVAMKGIREFLGRKRWGAEEGVTQRPMDLLVDASTGLILDLKYGVDPNDQWSAEEAGDHTYLRVRVKVRAKAKGRVKDKVK